MANLSKVMKKAHELARTFTGDYQARLSLALKVVWATIKKGAEKMDKRILKLKEISKQSGTFNRVWNEVEKLSKEIRGRKFNRQEQLGFNYNVENLIVLAETILSEEVKVETIDKKAYNYPAGVIEAKYDGFDAETGEKIATGDLIQHINGLGWVKADNC